MGVKFDGTSNTGLVTRLGAQTIYVVDALGADGSNGSAAIGGAAPSVSTMATGWTLPSTTLASNQFSEMVYASMASVFSAPSASSPAFVQIVQQSFASGGAKFNANALNLPNQTQGNRNIVFVMWEAPSALTGVQVLDLAGNVYEMVGSILNVNTTFYAAVCESRSIKTFSGANRIEVILVDNVNSTVAEVTAIEVSGCNPYAPLYGGAIAGTTSTGPGQVSLTATTTGDLMFAVGAWANTTNGVISGMTQRGTLDTTSGRTSGCVQFTSTGTTATNVGFTLSGSGTWMTFGCVLPQAVPILPNTAPSAGDAFVVQTPTMGNFFGSPWVSGTWTIKMAALVAGGTTPTGNANLNCQIWASSDGAVFAPILSVQLGTINLATTTQQNTSATINLGEFNLSNQYLYLQFALEVQSGAAPGGCTVNLVQDGTNSLITTPSFAGSMPAGDLTQCSVCFFFYSGTLPSNGVVQTLWGMTDGQSGDYNDHLMIELTGSSATAATLTWVNDDVSSSGVTIAANTWYFVAMANSGTGSPFVTTILPYVKPVGAPALTVVASVSSGNLLGAFVPAEIMIGTDDEASAGLYANGVISSVRLWRSILRRDEFERESESLTPVRTADLWEWWPLVDDVDYVGRVRGMVLQPAVLASSQTPFGDPPIRARRKQPVRGMT